MLLRARRPSEPMAAFYDIHYHLPFRWDRALLVVSPCVLSLVRTFNPLLLLYLLPVPSCGWTAVNCCTLFPALLPLSFLLMCHNETRCFTFYHFHGYASPLRKNMNGCTRIFALLSTRDVALLPTTAHARTKTDWALQTRQHNVWPATLRRAYGGASNRAFWARNPAAAWRAWTRRRTAALYGMVTSRHGGFKKDDVGHHLCCV